MVRYQVSQLDRGHMAAVRADDGWYFFRVIDFEDIHVEYNGVDVMAAAASTHSIRNGASAAATWQSWTLTDSNDMFYEWDRDKILQAFIGIDSPDIRLWRRIPSPAPRGNLSRTKVAVLNLNTVGFMNGSMTPFRQPDDVSEMILPWQTQVDFGLYNPTPAAVQPLFNIFIRRIVPEFIDPRDGTGQSIIKDIFRGAGKCRRWSPGLGGAGIQFKDMAVPGLPNWGSLSTGDVGTRPAPRVYQGGA